jgi:uncharacterized membrane protein
MLQKTRLEGLSDATFAIVFTLLVIEIHVPELHHPTTIELLHGFVDLWPLFVGYFVSFTVLAMFWMSHNFLYSVFTKNINRQLAYLNLAFLGLIALVPFFGHLLGRYWEHPIAVFLYGGHILLIGALQALIFSYAHRSEEIDTSHVPQRLLKQATLRTSITLVSTLIGMVFAFVSIPAALFFFAFPICFNIIPGTLDALERAFGFRLE